MSFFSDVLESIGSDKAPAPPPKPIMRPSSTDSNDLSKPVAKLGLNGIPFIQNGTKRKAEDAPRSQIEKVVKPNPNPGLSSSVKTGQPALPISPQVVQQAKLLSATSSVGPQSAVSSKVPPKGSFADIMARAKAAQDQRGQNQVGMIKHQPVQREKLSKLAERKREEEDKVKALKSKLGPRPGSSGKIEKRRSASPTKKQDRAGTSAQPRPSRAAQTSSYKGTMRPTSDRDKDSSGSRSAKSRSILKRRHGRYDEYLGTDEEDNSDIAEGEEDDYGSDESSDMEAGAFDIDEEENRALKAAKNDDARELELEKKLKGEKEERRKKLEAMAAKRR